MRAIRVGDEDSERRIPDRRCAGAEKEQQAEKVSS
jgi:hypothetical protein